MTCDAWLDWPSGIRSECVRDDEHDGETKMHAAVIEGEYTNWTDSWPGAGRSQSGR